MSQEEFNAVAQRIIKARKDVCATGPISADYPHFGMDDAYAVQRLVIRDRVQKGGRITGYKIGLTSETVQKHLGWTNPITVCSLRIWSAAQGSRLIAHS